MIFFEQMISFEVREKQHPPTVPETPVSTQDLSGREMPMFSVIAVERHLETLQMVPTVDYSFGGRLRPSGITSHWPDSFCPSRSPPRIVSKARSVSG